MESPDGGNRLKHEPNAKTAAVALVGVGTISSLFPLMAIFAVEFHMSKGLEYKFHCIQTFPPYSVFSLE